VRARRSARVVCIRGDPEIGLSVDADQVAAVRCGSSSASRIRRTFVFARPASQVELEQTALSRLYEETYGKNEGSERSGRT